MIFWDKTYKKITKTGPRASFLFACCLLTSFIYGCSERVSELVFSGSTMGTGYQVKVIAHHDSVPPELADQIDQRLEALNRVFSTYQDDSELMIFNSSAVNEALSISPDMLKVMMIAQEVYRLSSGAFDPTVGPLVNLWGFGPDNTHDKIPLAEAIHHKRKFVGYNHLTIRPSEASAVRKTDIQLDMSAVAKGYAVDAVAELLTSKGITNYLVEIGGELRASGHKKNGEPWLIAIERPLIKGGIQQTISLVDASIATSGDYRNYFEKEGKRYSHTIDPRTGYPIEHSLASVSVVDTSTAKADALATAMMVMGENDALSLAEQARIPVYLLVKQGDGFAVKYSTAFSRYLAGE